MRRCAGRQRIGIGTLALTALVLMIAGPTDVAEARTAHPHFADGGTLDWAQNLSTAKAWARSRGKVIFVEVGNPRCPNCRLLCRDALPALGGRMQAAAVGLAADSRYLHPSVRRLFLNNVPRSGLRVLPWAAFLTADGEWITGWGGYTPVSTLRTHLSMAEARQVRAQEPQDRPAVRNDPAHKNAPERATSKPHVTPTPGAVPPAPDAREPDTRRKTLLSSKTGEGKCLGGNCGGGACTDDSCSSDDDAPDLLSDEGSCAGGVCEAPGLCHDGSGHDGSCEAPDSVLGPMLPWVRGQLPDEALPKTDERKMASRSDGAYAVGSPDAESITSASLPPPSVRRVEVAPSPEFHPDCDASTLLTGDPDAEFVVRLPPLVAKPAPALTAKDPARTPTSNPSPTANPQASNAADQQLDAVVEAALQGDGTEAERRLYAAMRGLRTAAPGLVEDAQQGREALRDWREIALMPASSLVRKHVVTQSRERYAKTRWARLFP